MQLVFHLSLSPYIWTVSFSAEPEKKVLLFSVFHPSHPPSLPQVHSPLIPPAEGNGCDLLGEVLSSCLKNHPKNSAFATASLILALRHQRSDWVPRAVGKAAHFRGNEPNSPFQPSPDTAKSICEHHKEARGVSKVLGHTENMGSF